MRKKIASVLIITLLIPAIIIACMFLIKGKQYYVSSLLIVFSALAAFFISLEHKKLQTRDLVAISSVVALAVAGRALLFMLPQVKLTCSIVILAAMVFGPDVGFICGALSMLVSNMFFGQGVHTPFQMFGMGLVAFLCGLIFYKNKIGDNRFAVAIVGGILCFAVYGFIVDTGSAIFFSSSFNSASMLAVYASGFKFNIVHGVTTFFVLLFAVPGIKNTFERIAVKYGLFGEGSQ
ncbi:MAG: ECF transporter S component [Saccharofermentans sp.]|nr:ECF transporter S component [Saccharofermentans sp.]